MMCPCYKCDHRFPACHGTCTDFQTWKSPHEAKRLKRVQEITVDNLLYDGKKRRYRPFK